MSTTFLEPGGDATGNVAITTAGGFWSGINGSPAVATDFVHGTHQNSIKYRTSNNDAEWIDGAVSDSGTRLSLFVYINALPSSNSSFVNFQTSGGANVFFLRFSTTGQIILVNGGVTIIGTSTNTVPTGTWARISIAYTITSTSVSRFEIFINGTSALSLTNPTLTNTGTFRVLMGNNGSNSTLDFRTSDFYVDNSSSLTDPGNIWVSAKRPFSNGTTNGFTTQIGAGGSGYGTGHAPQVNEVPLSTTNGWSMIGTGSAVTEEYTIEGQSVGFVSTAGGTIVDFEGWVDASSVTSETASIIVAGATSNISLTSSATLFTKIAGSTTYPVGGTDIGIVTGTTVTTVGLYECGILVAFIPAQVSTTNLLSALGAG